MRFELRKHITAHLAVMRRMDWAERLWVVCQLLAILLLLCLTFISPFGVFGKFFAWIGRLPGNHFVGFILFVLVLNLGVAAHRFKQERKRLYGIVEVLFGVGYAFSTAFSITSLAPFNDLFAHWATLVGCAYIIARGLSNISEAARRDGRS